MIIWLVSYPRSGNTFVRSVLNHYFGIKSHSVYGDPIDIGSNPRLAALVGHEEGRCETFDLPAMRASALTFPIKSHALPGGYVSPADTIFYINRDGRDASVSYFRYLQSHRKDKTFTLPDVLTGKVRFGFWGNHILQWHRAGFSRMYHFAFEEITKSPEAFADELASVLGKQRSNKQFPDLATFRCSAPEFFGAGHVGSFADIFDGNDSALFELFSGPAMRIAGYWPRQLSMRELEAYAALCKSLQNDSTNEQPGSFRV